MDDICYVIHDITKLCFSVIPTLDSEKLSHRALNYAIFFEDGGEGGGKE